MTYELIDLRLLLIEPLGIETKIREQMHKKPQCF